MMSIMDVLFSFEGHLGRLSYFLASLLLYGASALVDFIALSLIIKWELGSILVGGIILTAASFFSFWSLLAPYAKRLHDLGLSGWFTVWMMLVVFVGDVIGVASKISGFSLIFGLSGMAWSLYVLFAPG